MRDVCHVWAIVLEKEGVRILWLSAPWLEFQELMTSCIVCFTPGNHILH